MTIYYNFNYQFKNTIHDHGAFTELVKVNAMPLRVAAMEQAEQKKSQTKGTEE